MREQVDGRSRLPDSLAEKARTRLRSRDSDDLKLLFLEPILQRFRLAVNLRHALNELCEELVAAVILSREILHDGLRETDPRIGKAIQNPPLIGSLRLFANQILEFEQRPGDVGRILGVEPIERTLLVFPIAEEILPDLLLSFVVRIFANDGKMFLRKSRRGLSEPIVEAARNDDRDPFRELQHVQSLFLQVEPKRPDFFVGVMRHCPATMQNTLTHQRDRNLIS